MHFLVLLDVKFLFSIVVKPILFLVQKIYTLTMECETKQVVKPLITPIVELIVIP